MLKANTTDSIFDLKKEIIITNKPIRKTATKLEIGTAVIGAGINKLIELLEKYRLEQLETLNLKSETKTLTEKGGSFYRSNFQNFSYLRLKCYSKIVYITLFLIALCNNYTTKKREEHTEIHRGNSL